jgi:hypothetical protein
VKNIGLKPAQAYGYCSGRRSRAAPQPHTFLTGWGDGYYPSFLGYDASGRVTCPVTDFSLLNPTDWHTA